MLYEDPYYDEVVQYYAYTSNGECLTEVANFRPPKITELVKKTGPRLCDPASWLALVGAAISHNLVTTILIIPAHSHADFIADVGGYLGLFLGASILSFYDIMVTFVGKITKSLCLVTRASSGRGGKTEKTSSKEAKP